MTATIVHGDCIAEMGRMAPESFNACITDPPYGIDFMGKDWDGKIAFRPDTWKAVYRLLKPDAYLAAFGGTRTSHRITCAIEDAGFDIIDTLLWLYGSGFPKSHNVSKAIDATLMHGNSHSSSMKKANESRPGNGRMQPTLPNNGMMTKRADISRIVRDESSTPEAKQWDGWGTALKPAFEPIILAQKPFKGTIANNVMRHGTGAIHIDACRIEASAEDRAEMDAKASKNPTGAVAANVAFVPGICTPAHALGRWPANVLHDGSDEVMAAFAAYGESKSPDKPVKQGGTRGFDVGSGGKVRAGFGTGFGDSGTAARFFYTAKADNDERHGSNHPTVKPTDLMLWLVKLLVAPGGTILDPFMGTGTTVLAAQHYGCDATGIDSYGPYVQDARRKIYNTMGLFAKVVEVKPRRPSFVRRDVAP